MRKAALSFGQTNVLDYFKILEEVGKLEQQNKFLRDSVKAMTERFRRTTCHQQTKSPISELLTRIMRQAISNSGANPKGRRYQDQVLVRFAINIWILGGRRTYEILYSNLQGAFPSPSTVQVKLSKFETSLIEGTV